MDRASDSGSEGWGFESLPVYQKIKRGFCLSLFFYREGLEESNPSCLRLLGRHRLDGGETAICAIGADANESLSACQRRIIRTTFAGSDYFYTL